MAILINKNTSGNALVLNTKEGLLYPVNLGSWTEVRIGLFIGLTNSSSTNAQYTAETLSANAPSNGFYCGMVTNLNPDNLLPYGNNQQFIGIGTPTGVGGVTWNTQVATNRISNSAGTSLLNVFMTTSGNAQYAQDAVQPGTNASAYRIFLPDLVEASGDANFACFYGIKFNLVNAGTTSQCFTVSTSNASEAKYTNVSIDNLRSLMANFDSPATVTGLRWNNQGNFPTGVPSALPSGILIFSPLFQNRLKIYAIDIEKY